MPTPNIVLDNAPAACVLAANDIDRGAIYGQRLDQLLPQKIYAHYFVLKRIYDNSGIVVGELAVGIVTLLGIGNVGDSFEVFVDDPDLGSISLGSYAQVSGDTTVTILAASAAGALNGNAYGYAVTSSAGDILITARTGTGDTINGNARLTVSITATSYITSEDGDYLITEDSNRIIIE